MKIVNNIGIQIASNNMDVYFELLNSIGPDANRHHWDVLYLYGVRVNKDIAIVPLEEEIQLSGFGKRVSYHNLEIYGHAFYFYDVLIIGNQDVGKKIAIDEEVEVNL